jgi:hypothetical protein
LTTKHLIIALTALLLPGCASLGPGAIQGSRTDYNVALRQTEDEQLLLNLVRLRYRDQVLFLEASALNTQFTFQRSAEAGAEFGEVDTLYGLKGRIAVEEKPTVTYTPLQGGNFVERVLSPIRQETLFLLNSSGWSSDRVFRTLVQQMNGVRNAPRASGPTPDSAPEYRQFQRVTGLLRSLELKDLVAGGRRGEELVLQFPPEARALPEYRELTQALGLDPERGVYPVVAASEGMASGAINVRLRSFVGVMYFLSQAVDVPAKDIAAGRVTVTRDESGRPFEWTRVTEGLMRIRSAERRPANPAVAVFYRGSWFYIDDADLDSKATFSMLGQVFALQSGNVESIAQVLTLPVGG